MLYIENYAYSSDSSSKTVTKVTSPTGNPSLTTTTVYDKYSRVKAKVMQVTARRTAEAIHMILKTECLLRQTKKAE